MNSFEEIPSVVFLSEGTIVAEPRDCSHYIILTLESNGQSKKVLCADNRAGTHSLVADALKRVILPFNDYTPWREGGGYLEVTSPGQIVLKGESMKFGKADHQVAKEMLQQALPEYTIKIET